MTTFLKALALVIGVLILIAFGMAVWIGMPAFGTDTSTYGGE